MRIEPTVWLTGEEISTLQEALNPRGLLESYGAPRKIVEAAERSSRWTQSGSSWGIDQIEGAILGLTSLRELLLVLSKAQADPEWIKTTKNALKNGVVPLILNPEKAVSLVGEVRTQQVEACDRALLILTEARQAMGRFQRPPSCVVEEEEEANGT